MYKLTIAGAMVGVALSHPVNHEIVKDIKMKTTAWTPMEVHENPLSNKTEAEIKAMMGTIIAEPMGYQRPAIANGVPASFDSRDKWSTCVHEIRDQ
jgi:hypothetical protein